MNSRSGELAVTSDATEGSEGSLKSQYPKISSSWDREVVIDKNYALEVKPENLHLLQGVPQLTDNLINKLSVINGIESVSRI